MSTDKTHKGCLTSSLDSVFTIQAQWIGKPIRNALIDASSVICRGITSRGIFLELSNNWIAFLSKEQIHGPLTLNFQENGHDIFSMLMPGDIGIVSSGCISFEHKNIQIDTAKAKVWSYKTRKNKTKDSKLMATRNLRICSFLENIKMKKELQNEYFEFAYSLYIFGNFAFDPQLVQIYNSLINYDMNLAIQTVHYLAGRGKGLTPSGDDFMAGMVYFFALNDNFFRQEDIEFRDMVLFTIRNRSTTISASLAECAAICEVDERIAVTADYLLCGANSEETAVKAVKDWGSSSGLDAISGFLTAIKVIELRNKNLNP